MASFRKYKTSKGETRFRAEVRVKGTKPYSKSFNRLTDAKEWARLQDIEMQTLAAGIAPNSEHTLAEAIDRYIEECMPPGDVKGSTRYLFWWRKELGDRYMNTIRPAELLDLRRKLQKQPKKLRKPGTSIPVDVIDTNGKPVLRKPKTIQSFMNLLCTVYNKAINEWEWTSYNPVQKVPKLKINNERHRFLSDHFHLWPGEETSRHWDQLTNVEQELAVIQFPRAYELPRLIEALKSQRYKQKIQFNNPLWTYYLFIIQLSTGLRFAEATHMVWEDNDIIKHPIVVVDLKNEVLILKSTKSDCTSRLKPLSHEAVEVLQKLYLEQRHGSPLVFHGKDGIKPFSFKRRIITAIQDAGLQDFHWHDLRHTTASYLSMMGAGQKEIMDALHHKSMKSSQRYQHLSNNHLRGLLNKLSDTILKEKESPSRF